MSESKLIGIFAEGVHYVQFLLQTKGAPKVVSLYGLLMLSSQIVVPITKCYSLL